MDSGGTARFVVAQGMIEDSSHFRIAQVIATSLAWGNRKPIAYESSETTELEAGQTPKNSSQWLACAAGAFFLAEAVLNFYHGQLSMEAPEGPYRPTAAAIVAFLNSLDHGR